MVSKRKKYAIVNFCNGTQTDDTLSKINFKFKKNSQSLIHAKLGNAKFKSQKVENKFSSVFVCEIDEEKGTIKAVQAQPYLMLPNFKNNIKPENNMEMSYEDRALKLAEDFGSSKMKKAALDRKRRMEASAAVSSNIKENIEKYIKISKKIKPADNENVVNILPLRNSEASCISEIYSLDSVVPEHLISKLNGLADEFIEYCKTNSDNDSSNIPTYITKHLIKNIENNTKNARLCLFWYYLYNFFTQMSKTSNYKIARKNQNIKAIPNTIRDYFRSTFLIYDTFSTTMVTKCLSHILVLTLHIDDFTVYYSDLVIDFGIKSSKFKSILKQLGCVFEKNSSSISENEFVKTQMARLANK